MAKKSKPIDSIEKPEIFTFKEFDKIKSELSKDLKKLKPRKPRLPTEKRLKSMPEKKAEGVLDETKKMLKDQIELKLLQKTERELSQSIPPQPAANTQPQIVQAKPLQPPPPVPVFKGVTPKDLKGVDNEILEKYIRLKILEQKPDYAPFYQAQSQNNKKSDITEIVEVVKLLLEVREGNKSNQSSNGGEKDSIMKYMMEQQRLDREFQTEILKKMHENEIGQLLTKIDELEARANVNPFKWLKAKQDEMEDLKDLFGKTQGLDPKTRMELAHLKSDDKFRRLEFQEKTQEKALERGKASEFTELVKDGMKQFSETISKVVGGVVGKIGKEQLDSANLPSFVSIEQIEQNPQNFSPPLPVVNNPLLQQNHQQRTNKKKYGGGFQVSEPK